ncbi:MAG: DUF4062 domain-containing protein, partial [Firmicutes bacterium]|nr:DUF4062 domain-containing protein [Bacillota bacterium]
MKWQNVYVFISSTFKDMHAERDYLVKYVFPELTEWCNERKIRLFDIDLRWGVTEEDSMKNKLATEICLKNIDKCRPFFLCFQGQRRGWVPEEADIPESTLKAYPKLKAEIGKRSVTEMEILHGVFSPYQEGHKKVAHPLFFFRDPSYLKDIGNEKLRTRIFGDHNPNNPQLEELQKKKQAEFHKEVKKKFGNCHNYTATFDPSVHSPELENDWLGKDVAEGRLTNFQVGGKPLKDIIISEFKRVITAELKVQAEKIEGLDEQETTLKLQEEYLFSISNDSYIEDEDARKAVLDAVDGTGRKLFLLSAEAGSGKSTFMAKRIAEFSKREDCIVMYRFLGTGAGCDTVSDLLTSIKYQAEKLGLMEEEKKDARTAGEPEAFYFSRLHKKIETPYNRIKDVYEDLKYIFNFILKQAAKKGKKVILFLDGLNQISERLSFDFDFLNVTCPPNVRVVASVKSGSENATKFLESKKNANIYQLNTFGKDEIKLKLIDGHLSQYLKAFDEKQSAILLNKKSSSNPLYLAVVLNEMRQFGAYDDVKLKLNSFGDSPHDAFITMLGSCQTETQYTPIPPADVIPLFFTSLAASRRGLSKTILIKLFKKQFKETYTEIQIEEALNFYLHRFRPYIVQIEGRFTILFETLTIAIKEFYKELIEKIHTYLADILRYETTLSPKNEDDIFAIKEYFYHFHRASYDEALKLLSDYSFLQHKIAHVGIKYLMEDYKLYGKENLPRTAARLFRGFKIDEKILNKDNLTAQLWLRFGGDDDEGIQEIIKLAEKDAPALWLKAKKADSERAWNVVSLSRSLPKPMGTPFKCVAETGTHYVLFQGNDIMDVSTKPAEMILLYKRNLAVADIVHFTHPVTNIEMSGRFIVARGKNYYSIYDPAHMCVAETVCVRKLMRELLPDEKSIQKKGWDVGGMEVIVNDPGGTKPIRIHFVASVGFGERLTVGYTAGKKDYKFHYKEVFEDDDEEDTNKCTSPFALCGKWLFSEDAIIDAQTMKVEGNVHDIIPAKEQNNHLSLLSKPVLFANKIYFGRLIMNAA